MGPSEASAYPEHSIEQSFADDIHTTLHTLELLSFTNLMFVSVLMQLNITAR